MDGLMIEAEGVGKAYGRTRALRCVDLRVEPGHRVALFGPNGAGKTTLMRVLSTLTRPDRGRLRLFGVDPVRRTQEVRRQLGVVSHRLSLYEDLTARENLEFYARLYGLGACGAKIESLLTTVQLERSADVPVRAYSRGMRQRLALVRSLLHEPRLLLLDEPDTGLDEAARQILASIVTAVPERGVVFSTHNVELGLGMANRVVVMSRGSVVFDGPAAALERAELPALYGRVAVGQ